jgi:hypothetical protein
VFSGLLEILMKQAHRGLRRKLAEAVYLIDATSVRLSDRSLGAVLGRGLRRQDACDLRR